MDERRDVPFRAAMLVALATIAITIAGVASMEFRNEAAYIKAGYTRAMVGGVVCWVAPPGQSAIGDTAEWVE